MHQTFADGDAIGHDIQGMYDVFDKMNVSVAVFCEYNLADPKYRTIDATSLRKKIKVKNNIVIYHHSIHWEFGETVLQQASCQIVVRYHNITPTKFFKGYSKKYVQITEAGRLQTQRLAENYNFYWLSASNYNNLEILGYGVDVASTDVVAPFHKIEHMDDVPANQNVLSTLIRTSMVNVLFIGRVASNKGHKRICKVARAYKELFGNNFVFWIVGGFDNEISKYNEELQNYIYKWGLQDNVIFTQKVPIETLKSYILGCDLFLCVSEHEGFCVPLIECQYHGLPVVACESTAIGETLGQEQLLFSEFDEDLIASAIHEVATDKETSSYLIEKGRENYYSRFTNEILAQRFFQFIDKVSGGTLS
ncbi:glycosyltransferase [Paenibacillus xerothermodurans]|uniref:Glycosyltransferase family 1 protein n=1 Tax=Paenibacillus xerothermodurans TaxID=1977292 RepID=A0A2W1NPI2_PAEXE|nr:glycosyltransferase [Paenibacillus xerothermodurans]PZE20813.1 glycosyltransferase family 1 protein [Paenibacillus xerothermodurans]